MQAGQLSSLHCPSFFSLFLCHPFDAETAYLNACRIFPGEECVLVHAWLSLWNRENPRCQPRWVTRTRGVYAMLQVFFSMMYYLLHSHGLLQASLTTLETTPSLTNGRSVNIRITTRRRVFCRTTGILGSPRATLLPSLLQGMELPL